MRIYSFLIIMFFVQIVFSQDGVDTLLGNLDNLKVENETTKIVDLSNSTFQLKGGKTISLTLDNNTSGEGEVLLNNEKKTISFVNGVGQLPLNVNRAGELFTIGLNENNKNLYHISASKSATTRVRMIPGWTSILPPLVAILLALIFKEVIVSLFIGIWSGAFIAGGFRIESLFYFIQSFFETITKYIIGALNDSGHLSVVVFSLLIGGMVAIISKNGGMTGVVNALAKYASTRKKAQLMTWFMGMAIFFDDYANTLIVGNTMRSLTDGLRISREKLAYIVDSTAAPVSAIAFITTWIGAELGFISSGLAGLDNFPFSTSSYLIFFMSLKYSFYPILTLIFIYLLIKSGKDFGPMYQAEKRAFTTGQVSPAKTRAEDEPNMEDLSPIANAPLRWTHAFWPIVTTIFITMFGLFSTGMDSSYEAILGAGHSSSENWSSIWKNLTLITDGGQGFFIKLGTLVGNADSYAALLWGSLSGVLVAIGITLYNKVMNLWTTMHWMVNGFKTMMPALIILTLAWALAICTDELHTADFLTGLLGDGIHPAWIPPVVFLLSFIIAFSTGSSWSTMAILFPIAIPLVWAVSSNYGIDQNHAFELILNVIATVLAASVLGDHCSPISDTTILSSLATDCNHIDHVRTQMPYALVVGASSFVCVTLSALFAWGAWFSLVLIFSSVVFLYFFIEWKGKKVEV